MDRSQILERLLQSGVIAIIRLSRPEGIRQVVEAIREGGVDIVEITMTVPDALLLIRETTAALGPRTPVGVGSVMDSETAHRAVDSGARFVVSPVLKREVIEAAHDRDVPVLPGCFTPTEILTAHDLGADLIKVFPADHLGMPYIESVLAPMPDLKLMPTGGVTLDNAGDWLRSGAAAVGVGSALLDPQAIAEGRYEVLAEKARRLRTSVERGRSSSAAPSPEMGFLDVSRG